MIYFCIVMIIALARLYKTMEKRLEELEEEIKEIKKQAEDYN